jgi:heme/copper-type cytochrome/quinol oxidase subunit 3
MTTHAAALDRGGMDATEVGMGVYNMKLGMWVFLLSEVMFFTSLIGSYIILRSAHPDMFAQPGEVLAVNLTAFNTFLLICSSVTMVLAFAAIERGDQAKLKAWLIATALIGMSFLGVQVYEYIQLSSHGFVPSVEGYSAAGAPLYGSTFYTMTGFHGFHVFVGVLALWYLVIQAFRGKYTVANHGAVEITGLYWHFVDLVWIILFTIVYLI